MARYAGLTALKFSLLTVQVLDMYCSQTNHKFKGGMINHSTLMTYFHLKGLKWSLWVSEWVKSLNYDFLIHEGTTSETAADKLCAKLELSISFLVSKLW